MTASLPTRLLGLVVTLAHVAALALVQPCACSASRVTEAGASADCIAAAGSSCGMAHEEGRPCCCAGESTDEPRSNGEARVGSSACGPGALPRGETPPDATSSTASLLPTGPHGLAVLTELPPVPAVQPEPRPPDRAQPMALRVAQTTVLLS